MIIVSKNRPTYGSGENSDRILRMSIMDKKYESYLNLNLILTLKAANGVIIK